MDITHANTIVIKVGTSTLTYPNGKLNLRGMASLCKTISDLQNSGKKIILVSSGAIGVGMGKLDLKERPHDNAKKQALAAIGQCELMLCMISFSENMTARWHRFFSLRTTHPIL